MALVVFFMMGIALWHFTVFLPDRFWQGIVGALLGARHGVDRLRPDRQEASGKSLGDTDLVTALIAIPGVADRARDRLGDRRSRRGAVGVRGSRYAAAFRGARTLGSAAAVPSLDTCRKPSTHSPPSPMPTPRRGACR